MPSFHTTSGAPIEIKLVNWLFSRVDLVSAGMESSRNTMWNLAEQVDSYALDSKCLLETILEEGKQWLPKAPSREAEAFNAIVESVRARMPQIGELAEVEWVTPLAQQMGITDSLKVLSAELNNLKSAVEGKKQEFSISRGAASPHNRRRMDPIETEVRSLQGWAWSVVSSGTELEVLSKDNRGLYFFKGKRFREITDLVTSSHSIPPDLRARLEEMNVQVAHVDLEHRRLDRLTEELDKLACQQETIIALTEWMTIQLEAGEALSGTAITDHMNRLGFAIEDIRDASFVLKELDLTKAFEWPVARMKAVTAKVEALGENVRSIVQFNIHELRHDLSRLSDEVKVISLQMPTEGADACGKTMRLLVSWAGDLVETYLAVNWRLLAFASWTEKIGESITLLSSKMRKCLLPGMPDAGDREPIPDWMRRAVLDRDQGICRYCGQRAMTLHLNHIVPVCQGGRSTVANLVTSCAECNRKKGGRTPEEAGMIVLPPRTPRE